MDQNSTILKLRTIDQPFEIYYTDTKWDVRVINTIEYLKVTKTVPDDNNVHQVVLLERYDNLEIYND